jgi:hypothetical protein
MAELDEKDGYGVYIPTAAEVHGNGGMQPRGVPAVKCSEAVVDRFLT